MSRESGAQPPFSHRVRVGHVSHNPIEVRIEADANERMGLAGLWDILGVQTLSADLKLRRWKKDGVKVFGTVHAEVTQACVVTLDPVVQIIDEEIEEIFVPEGSPLARITANDAGEIILDPEGPDMPELFSGDEIDVGTFAAEMVAMALDPYPRKPDIEFKGHTESDAGDDRKPSPFAVLKTLKTEK
jgi:uncharacterized metal-binding protein YceD (DUF177 family)